MLKNKVVLLELTNFDVLSVLNEFNTGQVRILLMHTKYTFITGDFWFLMKVTAKQKQL